MYNSDPEGTWRFLESRGFSIAETVGAAELCDWTASYVNGRYASLEWMPESCIRKAKALCAMSHDSKQLSKPLIGHLHKAVKFCNNFWFDAFKTITEAQQSTDWKDCGVV